MEAKISTLNDEKNFGSNENWSLTGKSNSTSDYHCSNFQNEKQKEIPLVFLYHMAYFHVSDWRIIVLTNSYMKSQTKYNRPPPILCYLIILFHIALFARLTLQKWATITLLSIWIQWKKKLLQVYAFKTVNRIRRMKIKLIFVLIHSTFPIQLETQGQWWSNCSTQRPQVEQCLARRGLTI